MVWVVDDAVSAGPRASVMLNPFPFSDCLLGGGGFEACQQWMAGTPALLERYLGCSNTKWKWIICSTYAGYVSVRGRPPDQVCALSYIR